ncbi:MAG TPA: pyridoxal phosphate-dependent aminotransferase, partial [Synergistales bacterium]|nr:pyridoxal phosphate-dependent aminotransferase [Synergistales bacterium]
LMLKIFQAAAKVEDLSNLGIGEPDFDTEPDIIEAATKAGMDGFTHYPPVQGYLDLREEICRYWDRRYGLQADPEEVFITCGGIQCPDLLFQALLDPGDEVILTEPCFTAYFQQVEYNGGKVVPVPCYEKNGFAPSAEDIEKAITPGTKVLMLNSPSNPTGAVIDRKTMEEIAQVAERHDLFVLSDEVYDSIIFEGEHISFATLPGMKERTLTVGSFSKSHAMTGWRIGYAIGPRDVIRMMVTLSIVKTFSVNTMAQKAALYALKTQDRKILERNEIYRERVNYVAERLNRMPGVRCLKPMGSFYLFPNITGTGMESEEFCWWILDEAKVAVIPGICFGKSGEGHIRISCALSMDKLARAMDRMEKALRKRMN